MSALHPDLEDALARSACLGPWSHQAACDRFAAAQALTRLLGLEEDATAGVPLAAFLARIEEGTRVESVLLAARQGREPFEVEFRTRGGPEGRRWLRLMGRGEHDRATGLAFDLTEERMVRGSAAREAQRRVNRLADHVVAMKGLVEGLPNPPLARLVDAVALAIGFELARRLQPPEGSQSH